MSRSAMIRGSSELRVYSALPCEVSGREVISAEVRALGENRIV